jgi:hypothetical protein
MEARHFADPRKDKKLRSSLSRNVLASLIETLLADTSRGETSFKEVCNTKLDENGNFVFGLAGSELRRGKIFLFLML